MGAAVIAHGDAPPVFQFSKHVLDFVALFVECFIVPDLDFAVLLRRDAGRDAFFDQSISEPVRVITPVRQKLFCFWQLVEQQGRALVIAHLACGKLQQDRPATAIGHGMKL